MLDLNQLASECHAIAVDKGWYDQTRTIPELLMLVVSELAEALEEVRNGYSPGIIATVGAEQKPVGFAVEIADSIIRILDMCSHLDIDIQRAVEIKMAYNRTRPHRHGGKAY